MESLEIKNYITRLDLLNETVEQIKKDIGESGLTIVFSGKPENAFAELIDQLSPYVKKLLSSDNARLRHLLYRIDVPEKLFHSTVNDPLNDPSKSIAELIIKRELQKVVIRNFYRLNNPPKGTSDSLEVS